MKGLMYILLSSSSVFLLPCNSFLLSSFPDTKDQRPPVNTIQVATRAKQAPIANPLTQIITLPSGWYGPGSGARSAPENKQDLDSQNAIKERVEADEKEKRDIENSRRVSMGQKPHMYSIFISKGRRALIYMSVRCSKGWFVEEV